ncbi:hypothetical protein [Paenibacillus arenilitoris]|uniref:Transposase n=1 Tax=Paenibacillus arenilitoris TaxID=2772299 RepID=A0A927CJ11_9BACL|nr:hypothetical protein [Paenibacillus arenilitoris]MBD2868365.1 hypothetical protein [Paenibacillus arenilitoris]
MDKVPHLTTIRQCLNLLEFDEYRSIFDDHRARKLTTGNCIQQHVVTQSLKLESYDAITERLRASKQLQSMTGLASISSSALSRKTNQLCTHALQGLFTGLAAKLHALQQSTNKINEPFGKLRIVDGTDIILPRSRAAWANHCPRLRGVKMHTSVIVGDPDCVYPDRIKENAENEENAKFGEKKENAEYGENHECGKNGENGESGKNGENHESVKNEEICECLKNGRAEEW